MRAFLLLLASVLASVGIGVGAEAAAGPGGLPTGEAAPLDVAGSLAVGPTGTLYVAAPSQHRILVFVGGGRFRVVAGNGRAGCSGDGGPAVDAELTDPSELTFGTDGSLVFVDGGRVRVIGPDGVIRTIAGNGVGAGAPPGSPSPPIADGTPARSASLGSSPSIALGPSGQIYLDTADQLLKMTSAGTLEVVRTRQASFKGLPRSLSVNLTTLAVDSHGDLDVAGFNGWAAWVVRPDGTATYVGYDRGSGGSVPDLVRGPDGAVYAENDGSIVRLETTTAGTSMIPVYDFGTDKIFGQYFWLTDFAFGPGGEIYADEIRGSVGFERFQQLVSLENGRFRLLWQESSAIAERAG